MDKKRGLRLAVLLAAALILGCSAADAIGLRTKFGQVRVRGLKIGQTYSLNSLLSLPLRLVNSGDRPEVLRIDVMPVKSAAVPGYEPIPDSSWVKLEKQDFTVAPGHEAVTDIIVSIPNDAKLLGRRFEIHIWSRTTTEKDMYNVGVESQLLLEISSVPPTEDELKKKFVERKLANLDFTLYPVEGVAEDVPLGRELDLKKERKLSIKLVNPNDARLNFKIRSVPRWESLLTLPGGFEDPASFNWVRPATDTVLMEGNSIRDTALLINIPDDERYRGKSYMFPIEVEVLEQEIPSRIYYKLFVKTQKSQTGKKESKP
jgi:hypothetical protein